METTKSLPYVSKRVRNSSMAACGYLVSAWLLTYYLLPGTVWSRFSPFNNSFLFELGSSNLYWLLALAIFCTAVLFSYSRWNTKADANAALLCLVSLYLGVYILTALGWRQDVVATNNCFRVLAATSTGLLVARLCGRSERLAQVLCVLAAVQGTYALYYHKLGHNVFQSGDVARAGGTFNHPNGVYTVMMLCLPLVIACAVNAQSLSARAFWMICASVVFAALMITWYRGGILGAAFGVTWLTYRLTKSKQTAVLVAVALATAFLLAVYQRTNGDVNQQSSHRSVQGRYLLWHRGLGVFQHHWLTGVGLGALEMPVTVTKLNGKKHQVIIEPKNVVLHWLAEMGLGGGILFVLFVIAIVNVIRRHSSPIASALGASWLSLVVAGMFDTPFGTADRFYGNALVGALLGAVLLLCTPPKHEV